MQNKHHNLIAGEWHQAQNYQANTNPSDVSDVIGLYASGEAADVAVAAAAAAEAQRIYARAALQDRVDLLNRIAAAIEARTTEIGTMLAREEGKVLPEAIGETKRAAQIFRFFAAEAIRIPGDALGSVRKDVDVEVVRDPIGVVGIITPWNFPIAIPAWKIAPALAYGNGVVFKPAELTPGCAHLLAEIIHDAGCPKGLVNMVMGRGSVIGPAMVADPNIAAISFTGSVPTGRNLALSCAAQMKKVQLEMGGRNPMVVLDDADLNIAVEACLNGAFFSTGQRCTASSRFIVQDGIHDRFVEELTKRMATLRVGPALEATTQIGPVASAGQLDGNLGYVALAAKEGCEVVGGERINGPTEGYFQRPALFVGAKAGMTSAREEIFGPCASLIKVGSFEEAVAVANDTEFGLSSGICTQSLKYSREFRRQAQAGMVMVNLATAGVDYHVPFGGRKASSYGPREQGRYAAEFYTTVKTSYVYAG
ncbi:aldehyde dehydrogenase family protein [Oryzibacter oryziterrae]|uniref:aldehyde dehydrogenase family protein n=1 Tax=Oryzibacter oryziterrae TaxID=2766474 RepID=UPI001F47D744|nr:aldehyde dehydrogenase family protein [Oryzibacter oryziterrae]